MGHGHAHRAVDEMHVEVGRTARTVLLGCLGVALVATLVGLVVWFPTGDPAARIAEEAGGAAAFAAPGVTFPTGEVREVAEPCAEGRATAESDCGFASVRVGKETVDVQVPPSVLAAGLREGDEVELMRTPAPDGAQGAEATYSFSSVERGGTLAWLAVLFLVVVLAIARWRGLFAMIGLAFGGAVVWWFLLPALFEGAPGVGVALAGSSAIMFVVLYLTHGLSLRTSTALAGTLVGILITASIAVLAVRDARLTGVSDDAGAILGTFSSELDFQSLLGCALVIAGLGVLNDVTITQASAVWELRAASPGLSRARLFAGAMRIGRDHIASTIYTIVFAYVGTALVVLLLLQLYARPFGDLLSSEALAEEIVRTLSSAVGLVLAVPITTAIAAVVAASGPAGPQLDAD